MPKFSAKQTRGTRNHADGRLAEHLATLFLMLKGYRIIARRKRTPFGEIDIAVMKANTLVIVEVKNRGTKFASHAAISPGQQQRLHSAAQYVAGHMTPIPAHIRCDAILLSRLGWPSHIKNAF